VSGATTAGPRQQDGSAGLRRAGEVRYLAVQEGKVAGIEVRVSPVGEDPYPYNIDIENTGTSCFTDIDIDCRDILFWTDRFGLDTTHMPAERCYVSGDALHVDRLDAGQTVRLVRRGYGPHGRYDRPQTCQANITFSHGGCRVTADEWRCCLVSVQLPNQGAFDV
jgi:hypothetical protein